MPRLSATRSAARTAVKVVATAIQVILLARVVVLLFAPPATDPIVNALLNVTQPLVDPFRDTVRASLEDRFSGSILDVHALAALVGYSLIELVLVWALSWQRQRSVPLPPSPRDVVASDRSDRSDQPEPLRRPDPG